MTVQEAESQIIALKNDLDELNYNTPARKRMELACMMSIQALEEVEQYKALGTVEELKEAKEKQIPKKPTHIHEEYKKHQWKKKKNGEVDDWAWSSGYCNGVVCERCGESICVHCNPNYDDEPCIVDKDLCPNCGKRIWSYQHENYCSECGRKLDWEEGGTSD